MCKAYKITAKIIKRNTHPRNGIWITKYLALGFKEREIRIPKSSHLKDFYLLWCYVLAQVLFSWDNYQVLLIVIHMSLKKNNVLLRCILVACFKVLALFFQLQPWQCQMNLEQIKITSKNIICNGKQNSPTVKGFLERYQFFGVKKFLIQMQRLILISIYIDMVLLCVFLFLFNLPSS